MPDRAIGIVASLHRLPGTADSWSPQVTECAPPAPYRKGSRITSSAGGVGHNECPKSARTTYCRRSFSLLASIPLILQEEQRLARIFWMRDFPRNTMTTHAQTQPLDNWAVMFRAAPVAICVASLTDGMILDCNQCYEELTGVPREELIGRPAADLHVVSSSEAREQIASALDEQAAAFEVASQLRLPDGTLRATLSSLRVVEFANGPAVMSVTIDDEAHAQQDAAAQVEARALREQLTRMEREIARHNEREQRLISQIGGLVDQAGLLKSDVMRLKSLQQELNAEVEGLRKYGDRYRSDASGMVPGVETADAPRAVSAPKPTSQANEPLAALIAARLAAFEEQLQGHVAALRTQAAKLQADSGHH